MIEHASGAAAPPDGNGRLLALHEMAVALGAPVAPEPVPVYELFATITRTAREVTRAAHARLVLADSPVWRRLLPDNGESDDPSSASDASSAVAEGYESRATASFHTLEDDAVALRWRRLRVTGPISRAIATGTPIVIPDIAADTICGPHPVRLRHNYKSMVVVPLVGAGGSVLGTLSVTYPEIGEMSADDRQALDLFAAHAAAAIERVRVLDAERRRVHQAERMAATLASVGAAATLDLGLEALVRGANELLGAVHGTVRVRDPETGERLVNVTVDRGGPALVHRPPGAPRPGSYAAAIAAGGPSVLVEDFWAHDPHTYPYYKEMRESGRRSGIVVPIDVREKRIGSLHFDHPTAGFFTPLDVSLAETLASYAGQAVARLRLEEERDQRARLDGAMLVARTVAHEINNALSPVLGYAELLALRPAVTRDPQSASFVKMIGEAAEDAAAKVARLQRIVRLSEDVSPLGPSKPLLDMERSTG